MLPSPCLAVSSKDTSKATTMSVVVEKGLQVLEKSMYMYLCFD